ncbi:Hypothetical protein PAU_00170 [Photorhabdus asymbiotica]|uniref:Uncharacterized protein n=1 Tax=Photorhabdus asymbiotica subsp. asymbiotica (strain ATCC 43949 / 3105-77) TaxID=553480 RepID=C7BGT4_PHOAA|nr:Hypothetical protein PAU_00170 [Photorhabdus asymbiotica]
MILFNLLIIHLVFQLQRHCAWFYRVLCHESSPCVVVTLLFVLKMVFVDAH